MNDQPTQPTSTPAATPTSPVRPHGLAGLVDSGRTYVGRARTRAVAWTLGLLAAAMVMAAIIGGGWIPAIGSALAAAGLAVHRITARMDRPRCLSCGQDLTNQEYTAYGATCPKCGALHMPLRTKPTRRV